MNNILSLALSPLLKQLVEEFLSAPTEAREELIIVCFNRDLEAANFEKLPDGFIEWGCIEHGIVDIFAFEGQQIIRLDPKSGKAEAM